MQNVKKRLMKDLRKMGIEGISPGDLMRHEEMLKLLAKFAKETHNMWLVRYILFVIGGYTTKTLVENVNKTLDFLPIEERWTFVLSIVNIQKVLENKELRKRYGTRNSLVCKICKIQEDWDDYAINKRLPF